MSKNYFKGMVLAAGLFLSACTLAGCAGTTQAQFQANVAAAQPKWAALENVINIGVLATNQSPTVVAQVQKSEALIDADFKTLATSPVPTNFATTLGDVQTLVDSLPANVLSSQHKLEADAIITLLEVTVI